jgi:hypothetical protein
MKALAASQFGAVTIKFVVLNVFCGIYALERSAYPHGARANIREQSPQLPRDLPDVSSK